MVEVTNFRKNSLGTLSVDMKAKRWRKTQEFCVYPIDSKTTILRLQSDKRWVEIDTTTKVAVISKKGNTSWDMAFNGKETFELTTEQIDEIIEKVRETSGSKVGNNSMGMYCDNSFAKDI